MNKILIIAGHGEGDPGAVSKWGQEANLTRELTNLVYNSVRTDVNAELYDTSKDCYQQSKRGNRPRYEKYDAVLEIHFNAKVNKDEWGDSRFTGTGGYIHTGAAQSEQLGEKIVQNIEALGFKRWQIVRGDNLPIKSSLFPLKIKDFFDISSINISEEVAIGMDISLYLVRK